MLSSSPGCDGIIAARNDDVVVPTTVLANSTSVVRDDGDDRNTAIAATPTKIESLDFGDAAALHCFMRGGFDVIIILLYGNPSHTK